MNFMSTSIILTVGLSIGITLLAIAIPIGLSLMNRRKAQQIMATGTPGQATIMQMQDTGMRINDDPRLKLLLQVQIPGYAPYQIWKTVTVPMIRLPQVQPGNTIAIMADPAQPQNADRLGLLLR